MLPSLPPPIGRSIIYFLATEFAISLRFRRNSEDKPHAATTCLKRMFVILPIFTSDGKTECSHLYISLAELAANSNLYILVSLVIEFEISLVFSGWLVFKTMKWDGSMVVIPSIFTSDGKTGCFHLYISLAEPAINSNLYNVVSLVVECEISFVFSVRFVFSSMKMAWR